MLRSAPLAAVLVMTSLAAPAHADTVKGALCELQRLPPPTFADGAVAALLPPEHFACDFTQTHAAAYIRSVRWTFAFPHAERGKSYEHQSTADFVKFTRGGQYCLFVYQSGKKPNEPAGF